MKSFLFLLPSLSRHFHPIRSAVSKADENRPLVLLFILTWTGALKVNLFGNGFTSQSSGKEMINFGRHVNARVTREITKRRQISFFEISKIFGDFFDK